MAALANGRPIILMGNSLGTVPALYLAARFEVAGMVLRNPPPLRELIVGRYGWWNLWAGAWLIAGRVPRQASSIWNARDCRCPAVFLSSRKDSVVPAAFQDRVIQAYGGPYRLLNMEDADHADSLNLEQQRAYQRHLQWLREQAIPFRPDQAIEESVPEPCPESNTARRTDAGGSMPASRPVAFSTGAQSSPHFSSRQTRMETMSSRTRSGLGADPRSPEFGYSFRGKPSLSVSRILGSGKRQYA